MFSQFPKITKQKGTENIDKDKKETDFKEYHKKKKNLLKMYNKQKNKD